MGILRKADVCVSRQDSSIGQFPWHDQIGRRLQVLESSQRQMFRGSDGFSDGHDERLLSVLHHQLDRESQTWRLDGRLLSKGFAACVPVAD